MTTATLSAADFKKAVGRADMAREHGKRTAPILSSCLITIGKDEVTFQTSDLDCWLTVWCGAETSVKAAPVLTALPMRLLTTFAQGVDGDVLIEVKDATVSLSSDGLVVEVNKVFDPRDFPVMSDDHISKIAGIEPIILASGIIWSIIDTVRVCVSTEETRYYLNGIALQGRPGAGLETQLHAVATDGHRLGLLKPPGIAWPFPYTILPTRQVDMLARLTARDGNMPVAIAVTDDAARMSATCKEDGWRLITKLIDGTYPDWKRVIPPESDAIRATISRAAARRIARFKPNSDASFGVSIVPGKGVMEARIPGEATITAPINGAGASFGVNARYLAEFLRRHEVITLLGNGPGDPLRVITDDPNALHILMPMRV